MSWFGGNRSKEIAQKIEEATSESIPNGDIDFALALEISDLIRSKQIPAKDAMRLLKKRFIDGENANQQKAALKLIDFCIKNGGSHYILEIASKEFMDPLVVFLKSKSNNESVKESLLEMIQTWSILVSKDQKYDYINTVYRKLQNDGFEFPMITEVVDSTMIESKVAPEWEDSDACMMCSDLFTLLNRKHHCRSCGGVFCQTHSSETSTIPELGINIPVRICDNCYGEQKDKRKKMKHSKKSSKHSIIEGDDELRRAIELSLKDSGMANQPNVRDTVTKVTDDEDEAMRAAIAASLNDLKEQAPVQQNKVTSQPEESTGLYSNFLSDVSEMNYPANEAQYQPPVEHRQVHQESEQQQQPQQQQYQHYQPQQQQYQHYQPQQEYHVPTYHSGQQHQSQQQYSPVPAPHVQQPNTPQEQQTKFPVDPNSISGDGERKIVEFVDILSRLKTIPESQRVIDPTLVQLHTDVALMNSKVNDQITKQKTEIEKCQAMYAKSFAVSRLYDDILAYRLKQENQMQKTKSSYASKALRPAPPIPTAVKQTVAEPKPAQEPSEPPKVPDPVETAPILASEPPVVPHETPVVVSPLKPVVKLTTPSAPPSEDRLRELKGTVVPTRYALPPKLELPSAPQAPLPSAPKEEPIANLIDI